jgi:transposase
MPRHRNIPHPPIRKGPPSYHRSPKKPAKRGDVCLAYIDLLRQGIRPDAIAVSIGISRTTAYQWQANLFAYGSIRRPILAPRGRPYTLSEEDEIALMEQLKFSGWMYQDEMVDWLLEERGVIVSQATVSNIIRRNHWSRQTISLISNRRDEELRKAYLEDMLSYPAEDLIFIDESLFNKKTGWRSKAYAPIGSPARYVADIDRGTTYSILPAIDIDGYLPGVGIKEGYFSREDLIDWITTKMLPAIAEKYGPHPKVIVMDNVAIHQGDEIIRLIQAAGHIVKFLPPYSPDFNPIELTFSVLKAWIKRNYWRVIGQYPNYEDFLRMAVRLSFCDRYAVNQFRHSAKGFYLMRDEWEQLRDRIRAYEAGRIDRMEVNLESE